MNNQQFRQWCAHYTSDSPEHPKKPLIMGIINVTPDSFSDAGVYFHHDSALIRARSMLAAGADLLDIGGESSRPGALPISYEEELTRVLPLIHSLRAESDVCISIDTTKAEVMNAAVAAGAGLINDISALNDRQSLQTAVRLQVPVCLMHTQGTPRTMQENPFYPRGVVTGINDFFNATIERCLTAGLPRHLLILDPGFGFGKTVKNNLELIKHLNQFKRHNLPILLGVSRKSTLGVIVNKPAGERLIASVALNVMALLEGVSIIRTHDVEETKQALLMVEAVINTECCI